MADEYRSPLKEWRKKRKITCEKLEQMAGVSANTISRFEQLGNTTTYTLCRLADATGLTTDYLLGRTKQ